MGGGARGRRERGVPVRMSFLSTACWLCFPLLCCETYGCNFIHFTNRLRAPDGGRYVTAAAPIVATTGSTIAPEEQEQEGAGDDDHNDKAHGPRATASQVASPSSCPLLRLCAAQGAEAQAQQQAVAFRAAPLVPAGVQGGKGPGQVLPSVLTAILPSPLASASGGMGEERGLRVVGRGREVRLGGAPSQCVFPAAVWRIELVGGGVE